MNTYINLLKAHHLPLTFNDEGPTANLNNASPNHAPALVGTETVSMLERIIVDLMLSCPSLFCLSVTILPASEKSLSQLTLVAARPR